MFLCNQREQFAIDEPSRGGFGIDERRKNEVQPDDIAKLEFEGSVLACRGRDLVINLRM
jgi:hypothetical protein